MGRLHAPLPSGRCAVASAVHVVPDLPESGERERFAVAPPEEPRHLPLGIPDLLPLVEAVSRNDATPPGERALVRARGLDALGTGVDLPVADLQILRPRRHQSPPHEVEHPPSLTLRDDGDLGTRRHVVAGLRPFDPPFVDPEALGEDRRRRHRHVATAHLPTLNLLTLGGLVPIIKPNGRFFPADEESWWYGQAPRASGPGSGSSNWRRRSSTVRATSVPPCATSSTRPGSKRAASTTTSAPRNSSRSRPTTSR